MPTAFSLFGFFLLVGSVPLAIQATRRVSRYRQSRAWPKVRATVTRSFVQEGSAGDGMSHLPEFAFRYSVAGVEYSSGLHTEGLPFPGTDDDARQMLKRFPIGSKVQVAVNPSDPSRALLDTGFPKAWRVVQRASLVAIMVGSAITIAEVILAK